MTSQGLQISESNYFIEYDSEWFQFTVQKCIHNLERHVFACIYISLVTQIIKELGR